jgi:hypothetical protein
MGALLEILAPLAVQYGPGLEQDVVAAFAAKGYTVAQIDAIFATLVPYDKLGIDPNAPVKPAA